MLVHNCSHIGPGNSYWSVDVLLQISNFVSVFPPPTAMLHLCMVLEVVLLNSALLFLTTGLQTPDSGIVLVSCFGDRLIHSDSVHNGPAGSD